jgi:hypothetical protein
MFTNLTPHVINIFNKNNEEVLNVQPSGLVARIETKKELRNTLENGVELYQTKVTGNAVVLDGNKNEYPFPDQVDGAIIIVSGLFRSHFDREDLYQPGELVRDESGRPIGCIGSSR